MKTIGIVAHSAEGGSLCFITACREGQRLLGPHMHPTVLMSAIPMGLSMEAWEADDHDGVAKHLADGVRQVANAGADFYICPDNTAHIVLEKIARELPIPGLHIAQAVCHEASVKGYRRIGLLGTNWTMTGPVYASAFEELGMERIVPNDSTRQRVHDAIFNELCQGVFKEPTVAMFVRAIEDLQSQGAECVVLGCTEIPLIITPENSPLPTLDSTRLHAIYAVREAIVETPATTEPGWLAPRN